MTTKHHTEKLEEQRQRFQEIQDRMEDSITRREGRFRSDMNREVEEERRNKAVRVLCVTKTTRPLTHDSCGCMNLSCIPRSSSSRLSSTMKKSAVSIHNA